MNLRLKGQARMKLWQKGMAAMLALTTGLAYDQAAAMELAAGGKALAGIYVAADAPAETAEAARELVRVLKAMSGAELPLIQVAAGAAGAEKTPAVLVGPVPGDQGLKLSRTSPGGDGFRYAVQDGRLRIAGESPRGVYLGACRFLESLGCGWFSPGPLGEIIPARTEVSVPDNLDHEEFSLAMNRRVWYGGKNSGQYKTTHEWLRRLNGDLDDAGSWSHAWSGLVSKDKYFPTNPEFFAFSKSRNARRHVQLCTTNPGTVKIAAENLLAKMAADKRGLSVLPAGPNDGGGLCECPDCVALDTPGYIEPSSGKLCATDRVFGFANALAAETAKVHPDKSLGILVYSEYSRPPLKLDKLHQNVFPMIAPIRRCRIHGPGTPGCPTSMLLEEEIQAWGKLNGRLGFYVYNYHLADTLMPFPKITYFKRLQASLRRLQLKDLAWICESMDSWSTHAPTLYLSARLTWDLNLDIDREIERFYTGFYGAAAAPMAAYWNRIDQAWANSPTHTGSQYGLAQVWTDELLAACRADITAAEKAATAERERLAVAMAAAGLRGAELFIAINRAVNRCAFAEAKTLKDELQAHVAAIAKNENPAWAHERYAYGYFQTFSGHTVDGGAKALANGGKVLVQMPDVWKFSKDEQVAGIKDEWFKPGLDDSAWGTLATFSKSWDDQGLGEYMGQAWYRISFTMPEIPAGADIRLWFGGFDENIEVWLNGVRLGDHKGFAKPKEFENIAAHLRPGAANILAVRVDAGSLAELGTGGLMKPVMIYQAGKEGETPAPGAKPKPAGGVEYEM